MSSMQKEIRKQNFGKVSSQLVKEVTANLSTFEGLLHRVNMLSICMDINDMGVLSEEDQEFIRTKFDKVLGKFGRLALNVQQLDMKRKKKMTLDDFVRQHGEGWKEYFDKNIEA